MLEDLKILIYTLAVFSILDLYRRKNGHFFRRI